MEMPVGIIASDMFNLVDARPRKDMTSSQNASQQISEPERIELFWYFFVKKNTIFSWF